MASALGATPGVQRGCGYRIAGGIYLETGLAPPGMGKPVEFFMADPPVRFEPDHKVGLELVDRDGTWHVIDWIGEGYYPTPADFLEEVRRFGLSRRAPKSLDFSKLTRESRVLCVHRRAYLENTQWMEAEDFFADHLKRFPEVRARCGRWVNRGDNFHLRRLDTPCSRHWWMFSDYAPSEEEDRLIRPFASFYYEVWPMQEVIPEFDNSEALWAPGLFASFPLTRISVIRDSKGKHGETLDKIRQQDPGVDVDEEDA